MTICTISDAKTSQFIVSMRFSGLLPRIRMSRLMDSLEAALPALHAGLDAGDHYFYALDPTGGAWQDDTGRFDPWTNAHSRATWKKLARCRAVYPRLEAWLTEVEHLMAFSLFDGMFESEGCAFAEPLISTLALGDLRFVPHYTRFLRQWEMAREVHQRETITAIVRRHGVTPETEELLFTRVVHAPGTTGEAQVMDLLDVLNRHYGDFEGSALFRRIFDALNPPEPAAEPVLPEAA